MRSPLCLLMVLCGLSHLAGSPAAYATLLQADYVTKQATLQKTDDRIIVSFKDGDSESKFTEYRFGNSLQPTKPILYPVFNIDGKHISRQYPIDDTNKSEQRDHPHHKSVWFAHGEVNGVDFWTEKATIKNRSVEVHVGQIISHNDWLDGDRKICQDKTHIQFGQDKHEGTLYRWIDHRTTLIASETDVVLGDTKEGTFAIRTAPFLRLQSNDQKKVASAKNSEGITGKAIWGKKASWVCYSGKLDGKTISVVILDHPNNLRHPTTWHAREYGLIAANPFGLHHFQGAKKGDGNYRIPKDESLTLRYSILIIEGQATEELLMTAVMRFANRE